MTHTLNPQVKDAILSILLEAKKGGIEKVTRTSLIKYVYLLDFWLAEETSGRTFTEIEWQFHHFGPYSEVLMADLDFLSTQPSVDEESVTGKDKDYSLYSLGEWAKAKTFEALGLPIDVRLKLTDTIKRYAGDLAGLLNFIYFETNPMQGALPGSVLSFAGLQKLSYKTDIKTIRVPITDNNKIRNIQRLLMAIGNQWEEGRQASSIMNPPIRDALFAESICDEGMTGADGDYRAALSFPGDHT